MERKTLMAVVVAALVLLAGCSSGLGGGTDTPANAATDGSSTDGTVESTGSINFYISDQPNAIEDFEHLNVTITKIGLHKVGDGETESESESEAESETESESETETETEDAETETESETENEDAETETEDDESAYAMSTPEEESETPEPTETPEPEETEEAEEDESEAESESEDESESESDGDGEWVEYESNATVDLTKLIGDDATSIGILEANEGTYNKVFVYVSEINATLKTGEQVNMKLPSNKLQLNKEFTVGNGEEINFVFDIAVHKAGGSGKYILRPVVGESGTDVAINDVGDEAKAGNSKGKPDDAGKSGDAGSDDADASEAEESDETETAEAEGGQDKGQGNGQGQGNGDATLFVPAG